MADPKSAQPSFVKPKANIGGIGGTGSSQLFDISQFDLAVAQRGIRLIHMSAMPCPVGRLTRDDSTRRTHPDHAGCQGGYIYTAVGQATCLFTSNNRSQNWTDQGMAENDQVQVTLPRFYDNSTLEVKAVPWDRFYLAEPNITVVQWELAEWSGSGYDALKFPVMQVQFLIDWRGVYYTQGTDFTIDNGKIHWGSNAPGINPDTGLGGLYSVRYTYRPYYIVVSLGHEIRVADQMDALGNKTIVAMPYQISVSRENSRRNADNDPLSPAAESRQQQSPAQIDFANAPFTPQE